MFKLGQKVYIVSDKFEMNLPVGEYGYIIAYDRSADSLFDYIVRIPKRNKNIFLTAADIELEEVLVQSEVDRIEREALIDYALATRNEQLFTRVMNGSNDRVPMKSNEVVKPDDFVKQVNLRAWI